MVFMVVLLVTLIGWPDQVRAQDSVDPVHTRVFIIEFGHFGEPSKLDLLTTLIAHRANAKRIVLISAETGERELIEEQNPESRKDVAINNDSVRKALDRLTERTQNVIKNSPKNHPFVTLQDSLSYTAKQIDDHANRVKEEFHSGRLGPFNSLNYVIEIFLVGKDFDRHRELYFDQGVPADACFQENKLKSLNLKPFQPRENLPSDQGPSQRQDVRVTIVYDADSNGGYQIKAEQERFFRLLFQGLNTRFLGVLYIQDPKGTPRVRQIDTTLHPGSCEPAVVRYSTSLEPFNTSNQLPLANPAIAPAPPPAPPLVIGDIRVKVDADTATDIDVLGHVISGRDQVNPQSLRIETRPQQAASVEAANGRVRYKSRSDFIGDDQFTITIANTQGTRSAPATVTVTVTVTVRSSIPPPVSGRIIAPPPKIVSKGAGAIEAQIDWNRRGIDLDLHVFTPEFRDLIKADRDTPGHYWPKSGDRNRLFRDARQQSDPLSERLALPSPGQSPAPGRYAFGVEVVTAEAGVCNEEIPVSYEIKVPGLQSLLRNNRSVPMASRLDVKIPCDSQGIVRSGQLVLIGEGEVR